MDSEMFLHRKIALMKQDLSKATRAREKGTRFGAHDQPAMDPLVNLQLWEALLESQRGDLAREENRLARIKASAETPE